MSTNNRPEWAQGSEWENWIVRRHNQVSRLCHVGDVYVSKIGNTYRVRHCGQELSVFSAIIAYAIANLIAEDRGGWA